MVEDRVGEQERIESKKRNKDCKVAKAAAVQTWTLVDRSDL